MLAALRQRHTPSSDLARVLACWLALILLVQAQAALLSLVHGPAHRHAATAGLASAATPAPTGIEALVQGPAQAHAQANAHARAHEAGEPHHHAPADVALPADGDAALDDAVALAWLAVLPARGAGPRQPNALPEHALVARAGWALVEHRSLPPRRPPRG